MTLLNKTGTQYTEGNAENFLFRMESEKSESSSNTVAVRKEVLGGNFYFFIR